MEKQLNTVIITGANAGLGYACTRYLMQSKSDWFVVAACRNERKAQLAIKKIITETGNSNIVFQHLDLALFASVRGFVSFFMKAGYPPLGGIICNAGIAAGDTVTTTSDGIETTFQVNCLGHFLLVNLLLPLFPSNGRILFVSSELHRNNGPMKSFRPDYQGPRAMAYPENPLIPVKNSGNRRYSASKLCLLFYTYELQRRLALENKGNITVNAFNPGLMPDTGLGGLNRMFFTRIFLKYILPLFARGAVSDSRKSGKLLARLLIDEDYANVTGKYFDRDRIISSSEESYDRKKWLELWNFSSEITGLTGSRKE